MLFFGLKFASVLCFYAFPSLVHRHDISEVENGQLRAIDRWQQGGLYGPSLKRHMAATRIRSEKYHLLSHLLSNIIYYHSQPGSEEKNIIYYPPSRSHLHPQMFPEAISLDGSKQSKNQEFLF